MKQNHLSLIKLTSAMITFGTIGIFRKYIDLPSSMIAMARGLGGMLFLLAVILIGRKKCSRETIKKNAPLLLLSGTFIGFNWILLFEAYRYTTIATATLCYYMAPVIVIIASPFLLHERLTIKKAICVLCSLCGITLVSGIFSPSSAASATDPRGILLGLGAAVLYATVVLMNKFIKDIGAIDKTIVQLGSAGAVMIPYLFITENVTQIEYTSTSLIFLAIVAIVHTGIAYTFYFGSIGHLPAQTVAIFSYIDPVVAIVLAALIFHESMSILSAVGAALILGATLCAEIKLPRKK